jgi:hypothetical protein
MDQDYTEFRLDSFFSALKCKIELLRNAHSTFTCQNSRFRNQN